MEWASGPAPRHRLDEVADAFLPASARAAPRSRPSAAALYAAAPGACDTAAVLAAMGGSTAAARRHDLGGAVGVRLVRWERAGRLPAARDARPVLIWCPQGAEGLSLSGSLVLGRLGALLRPRWLTFLWFAGEGDAPGRTPDAGRRARAAALAKAAVPGAEVHLHCLGWLRDAEVELTELARRFG